ncbi:MAG: flavin reductase family protein [Myxococcota bacterium]|nr:flavin reductase family protein [Myxococcota bacterium]
MSVDADAYRAAMSRWATGVTIVTSRSGDTIHGMTVSDFCGVSLEPPLVAVCADKTANTHKLIEQGRVFAANVLTADQQALSNKFASKKEEFQRFDGLDCPTAVTGAPLIPGALVSFDCRVVAAHDAGDHVIWVGRVEEIVSGEGEPLLYFGGAYAGLAG